MHATTTNPWSTFFRYTDALSSVLQWVDIKSRICLSSCSKELHNTIFNETKDLDWKIRKSKYLIYSEDLVSSLKQIQRFEKQKDLPNIKNATIPSKVVGIYGFRGWEGESQPIEPLPWDTNTAVAFCEDKLQVIHFGNNCCIVREHAFPTNISTFCFNQYGKIYSIM